LLATILGSGMTALDGTIVNVALPASEPPSAPGCRACSGSLNAYTLTLAGLLLISGSLGDRLGRRRIFLVGTIWFALPRPAVPWPRRRECSSPCARCKASAVPC